MNSSRVEVCIVGAGPRGLSVLERLCANERALPTHSAVVVHLVDPSVPGAGQVWRPDQSRRLLMNTVASQVTVYTDGSAPVEGPIEPGPSLYEWARDLHLSTESDDHDEATLAEAQALGPDSYPTRALYGRYLTACFNRTVAGAPDHVTLRVHRSRAVAMADVHGIPGGPQGVRLEDGTRLNGLDAIVLAQGHVPARLTPRQERTAALARIHYLTYITPSNPADVDLSGIAAGENVILRGLGLNFFDYMALFTLDRGGSFVRDGDRLVYHASGKEPKMYASSRRGVPYHSRGENQKGAFGRYYPRLLTTEYIAALSGGEEGRRRLRFAADLWPLIAREVESVYYTALLQSRGRGDDREAFITRFFALDTDQDPGALLSSYGIEAADRWDWERIADPCGQRTFADRDEFREWLLEYLARDVWAARAGNVHGPLKAALDVLRDLRNEIRLVVDHGGLEGDSYRDDLEGWYTPLNAFLSIGPPVSRIEEMAALIRAGVLEITGPGTVVRFDVADPAFVAQSTVVPGPPVRARVLIEARLPELDVRRTDDPLLLHLLATEQAGPYRIPDSRGTAYETSGLAVSERPYHLLDARGQAHPRRFAFGVPTESVHWVTAAGIRPGVGSVTLGDSDAIARAVLRLPSAALVPAGVRPRADDTALPGADDTALVGVIV